MAKKGAKVDDLLEQLKDDRVSEFLLARLTASLTPVIEGIFNRLVDAYSTRLDQLVESHCHDLIARHCESQDRKTRALEEENDALKSRLDLAEADSKMNNLVIHGLEEAVMQSGEGDAGFSPSARHVNLEATTAVISMCNSRLGLSLSEADISSAFRISRRGKDNHRPIIVKFISQRTRDQVYMARLSLRRSRWDRDESKIFINEHLTQLNALIYAGARKLVKEKRATSTWTSGGRVHIRLSAAPGAKALKLPSLKSLEECLASESTPSAASR